MFNTTHIPSLTSPKGPTLWYTHPECAVAPYGFIFYYAVKVFNLVVGTPCNFLVISHIATKKSDACTSDIFVFNLAIVDVYFCLMMPVDLVHSLAVSNSHMWYLARFSFGVKDVAPLFLVCTSLDRYVAVVHPVLYNRVRDNKNRIALSVLVWGLLLANGLSKSLLGSNYLPNIFTGVILFAFTVMILCNISIVWLLRRSVVGKERMHPVKKKAFKMVLINLAIVVFNYLPPVALFPFASYYSFVIFNCQIRVSVYGIMDLSCTMEPLLYITKMKRLDNKCCSRCFSKTSKQNSEVASDFQT